MQQVRWRPLDWTKLFEKVQELLKYFVEDRISIDACLDAAEVLKAYKTAALY